MIRRAVARLLTVVALLAASVAWAGWVYLHTAGDPSRMPQIARAVLADPAARRELANAVASAVADAANTALANAAVPGRQAPRIDGANPTLRTAVDAALADPRVEATVVDALAAAQASAMGVAPAHPATIDSSVVAAVVREKLVTANPALAATLPVLPVASIKVPVVDLPLARRVRQLAVTWVDRLALAAIAGLLLAFLLGGARARLRVVRAAGFWGIGAGFVWMVLPKVAEWAAQQWLPGHAALVRAILRGATGPVSATGTTLVTAGVAAVVTSFVIPRLPSLRRLAWTDPHDETDGDDRSGPSDTTRQNDLRPGFGSGPRRPRRSRRRASPTPERQPVDAYL
jgi:hypothetical protein